MAKPVETAQFTRRAAEFVLKWAKRTSRRQGVEARKPTKAPQNTLVKEGFLSEDLDVAEVTGSGEAIEVTPTTAMLNVYVRRADEDETYEFVDQTLTVTNRDPNFSASEDDYLQVVRINGEWRPSATAGKQLLKGKTDAAHNKGASGTVSIWSGTKGSETDTTENVTAWNTFANIGSGKWVVVAWVDGGWELIAAEC